MFNSLKYAKILEDAGLSRNQAETHIQILSDVIGEEMATKHDLKSLETVLKAELGAMRGESAALETSIRGEIKSVEQNLKLELQSLEHRMTIRLGTLLAAFLATGLTAAKLLFI